MNKFIIFIILILTNWNLLSSQNYPSPKIYDEYDYTLIELKINNENLYRCLDTLDIQKNAYGHKNKYDLFFEFKSSEPFLYVWPLLPVNNSNIYGYFIYKGYTIFVLGAPNNDWFKKLNKNKRFIGKQSTWFPDAGCKFWHFKTENNTIISVKESYF